MFAGYSTLSPVAMTLLITYESSKMFIWIDTESKNRDVLSGNVEYNTKVLRIQHKSKWAIVEEHGWCVM